jgi:hypothetical protein
LANDREVSVELLARIGGQLGTRKPQLLPHFEAGFNLPAAAAWYDLAKLDTITSGPGLPRGSPNELRKRRRKVKRILILVLAMLVGAGLFLRLRPSPSSAPTSSLILTPEPSEQSSLTLQPQPTPTLAPTHIPGPSLEDEWEKIFFPFLPQIRSIPGNENARVEWEKGDKRFKNEIYYPIKGVKRIPLSLLESVYCDSRRPVFTSFIPPRYSLNNETNLGDSPVSCGRDEVIVMDPEKGIRFTFILFWEGSPWLPAIPPWDGPPPP